MPRVTIPVLLVLSAMLERPTEEWYGLDLASRAELKSGTIYPVLSRLEQADWMNSRWENVDPAQVGRPRRRLYRLTAEGQRAAEEAVARHITRMQPGQTAERPEAPQRNPTRAGRSRPQVQPT
jgi:PadR family transcriptional regulator PadR